MQRVESVKALRAQVKAWRQQGETIAFVPTMGNLHAGHLSLVAKARELADKVIVSIFVNPLQFDDKSDLSAYPRTLDADIEQLTSVVCDLVFTPTVEVMYPQGMDSHTKVVVPDMDDKLCGQNRPGHFDGVATVVSKLFNMVQADVAVFGDKDFQQLLLIKKLALDLNLAVEVIGGPTFREPNGLAMSSRNQYLTTEQFAQAASLYQVLSAVKAQLEQANTNYHQLESEAVSQLTEAGFVVDYVEIRRAQDLEIATKADHNLRILAAAQLGKARLIDNIACNLA
ncbi:pantoate--beta-alanine ligase [Methylophaga sp. 41_12_T18]|nr:pantoate--beta-alanine ligase [Methylophaga sp. 41_12_T18]